MSLALTLGAGGALAALGLSARWNWWRRPAGGVPILMYHKIGDPPAGSSLKKLWVSVDQFRRQMTYLKKNGYAPMTFLDIASHIDEGNPPLPEKPVVLTFDDGYRNNYENAFPVLKEFGFRGVFFLVVEAVGGENFWHDPASETRLPMMSWEQAAEMQAAGMEIGSHTLRHPRLSRLEESSAKEEIRQSRKRLGERLGREPISFAYPYGDGQDSLPLQNLAAAAGYRWAVSVHQGKAAFKQEPYCLHRLFIRGDDFLLDFHLQLTRGRSRL